MIDHAYRGSRGKVGGSFHHHFGVRIFVLAGNLQIVTRIGNSPMAVSESHQLVALQYTIGWK